MGKYAWLVRALSVLAVAAGVAGAEQVKPMVTASSVVMVVGKRASAVEKEVADALAKRLAFRSDVTCSVVAEDQAGVAKADLLVYMGVPANHDALAALCVKHGVTTPTTRDPGPEGFAVRTAREGDQVIILAAGVEPRSAVYAAGEINRQVTVNEGSIDVPDINVRTAPAFWVRGANGHSSDMLSVDLAFAGQNFGGGTYAEAFGLKPAASFHPNRWWSDKPYPQEWQSPTEGRGYLCPSVPEARKALLAQWDEIFKKHPGADIVRFKGGDPGGCRCPKCTPWGKTFIHLCEDLSAIWHKYHPNSLIEIANQNLDNAGDKYIFDYLNEKPRTWLWAICYAPGSNAMDRYFRSEQREDLFAYPGTGPINRYLREILNNIPKYQVIDFFSDTTHWYSSEFALPHCEPHLVAVYGRRTFHVRPRQLYSIFQAIMPFSVGDRPYSEGIFDECNQYLWSRLLWNPHLSVDDVMMEYCKLNFGPAAAPEMMQAIYQLEDNLQAPLATNQGIDRFYILVKSAGFKIPAHIMRHDARWRLYMQKAALDKYVQLELRRQLDLRDRATRAIQHAVATGNADAAAAAAILDEPQETAEMAVLHAEAERLARELADLDPAEGRLTQTDSHYTGAHFILLPETDHETYQEWERYKCRLNLDFVSLGWMRRYMQRAQKAEGAERLRLLQQMVSYEDPGPGGFYDDLGDLERQPHLVSGETPDTVRGLDPENRPSVNTIAYSRGTGKGVTLRYEGLDPEAQYKVRLTLVAPRMPGGSRRWGGETKEHVVANGKYVARDVVVPVYTAQQFEYDIPQDITREGILELSLENATPGRPTVASEVWLIKRK
jgi:hypothetical protein